MTTTYTETYTATDIGKVLDCFAGDYDGIVQSTGLRGEEHARKLCHDVRLLALEGYLSEVNIVLRGPGGKVTRAAKYEVSTEAGHLTAQRPGNFLWPRTPDGELSTVLSYNTAWSNLGEAGQKAFRERLRIDWRPSNIDTAFPGLTRSTDRNYVSNAFALRKSVYE